MIYLAVCFPELIFAEETVPVSESAVWICMAGLTSDESPLLSLADP